MRLLTTLLPAGSLLLSALTLTSCDSAGNGPPRRAVVTAVQIDDGPLVDVNGDRWDGDAGGGPEIYFRLFYADVDFVNRPGDDLLNPRDDEFVIARNSDQPWYDDVQSNSFPLFWNIDGGFDASLDDEYRIALFDYDPTTSDDVMISAEPFTFGDFAPSRADGQEDVIVLEGIGADRNEVQVRLRVVYED